MQRIHYTNEDVEAVKNTKQNFWNKKNVITKLKNMLALNNDVNKEMRVKRGREWVSQN